MDVLGVVLFHLFGLPVTAYALSVVCAAALSLAFFHLRCSRGKLKGDTAGIFGVLALPLGLMGARLFYCTARFYTYEEIGFENVLRLWDGGYALWGAVGGAALAAVITARLTRQSLARVMDALAAPAALMIALCRFAEYFSGEGYGPDVEIAFFQRFPFAVYDDWYEVWYWAIFMAEGLWAALIMLVLLRCSHRPAGDVARLFFILYCAGQVLFESLRRDSFLHWLFVRVSQLTAVIVLALIMLAALLRWIKAAREKRISGKRLGLSWLLFAACVGGCVAMEFAVDKSPDLPVWAAYLIMAACCVGLGVSAYQTTLKKK